MPAALLECARRIETGGKDRQLCSYVVKRLETYSDSVGSRQHESGRDRA